MRHEDPLHAFARDLMAARGAPASPAEVLRLQRVEARRECVKAYRIALGAGLFMIALGLGLAAYGFLVPPGAVGSIAAQRGGGLFAGVIVAITGSLFLLVARPFNVPWDLEARGRLARAVVVSLEPGTSVRRGKRGPIVLTVGEARLAVQVDGGPAYEAVARVALEVHGALMRGEEIAVRVDPANPKRVLVCEPRVG